MTQYVANHTPVFDINGWTPQSEAVLTPTADGGRITYSGTGTYGNVYVQTTLNTTGADGNTPVAVGGVYALSGLKVRRNTATEYGTLQVVLVNSSMGFNIQSRRTINVDAADAPVGEWVSIPDLVMESGYNSFDGWGYLIIEIHVSGLADVDWTFSTATLYGAGDADKPAGAQLQPAFTYLTNFQDLDTAWSQDGKCTVSDHLWDFGDGNTSTEVAPYYTYALAGTYNVTHEVTYSTFNTAGTESFVTASAMETVTLTAPPDPPPAPEDPPTPPAPEPPPVFTDLNSRLRLEVASTDLGTLRNLLVNPNGDKGGFGWATPTDGSTVTGTNDPDGYTGYETALLYRAQIQAPNSLLSDPVQVDPLTWINACWDVKYVGNYYRAYVEILDSTGTVVAESAPTGYVGTLGFFRLVPTQIPATGVWARLRFDFYADTAGRTDLALGWKFSVNECMLATGQASTDVDGLVYADTFHVWRDILGPTHEIKTNRQALDLGTLQATVLDPDLDPAVAPEIRPGNLVRLRAADYATGTLETLFEGEIVNGAVTYVGGTRIQITAVDAAARLAATSRAEGVATVAEIPALLEGAGVPWIVNGSGSQVGTYTPVAYNANASLLDQIAVTRDTVLGYAWVDRNAVVQVWDKTKISTAPVATVDETTYSNVDVAFNTDTCINAVTVKWLRYVPATADKPAGTEEVVYGPYRNEESIRDWGLHPAEFTIQGTGDGSSPAAQYAGRVMGANATPVRMIRSARLPIRGHEDVTPGKALLDLYDLVTATYDTTSRAVRVTGVSHEITPTRWTVDLSFEASSTVAAPQVTPSPPAAAPRGTVGLIEWSAVSTALDGRLVADGATYAHADYPALGEALNPGGTTFQVPNLVDRMPVGAGGAYALLEQGGEAAHTLSVAEMPSHDHPWSGVNTAAAVSGQAGTYPFRIYQDTAINWTGSATSMGETGGNQPHNNMPPYTGLVPLIRTF